MLKKMGAVAAISLMVLAAHADAQMGKFSFNMYETEYKTAANAKKSYDAMTIEAGFVYKF